MTVAQIPFEAFFIEAGAARCFSLYFPAQGIARGALLYLHPLAEEMNRARRMAALQARALAAAGFAVLQIDLSGCGDSSGDFGDATWAGWIENLEAGVAWLRQQVEAPLWLWGLRAGCLLGAALLQRGLLAEGLLMWQPVLSGEQALRQFLRLKTVADVAAGRQARDYTALYHALEQGGEVVVAGYRLNPALARGMAAAEMRLPAGGLRIECFEMAGGSATALSPALSVRLAQWRSGGHRVRGVVLDVPSFWQTVETAVSPALLQATVAALEPA